MKKIGIVVLLVAILGSGLGAQSYTFGSLGTGTTDTGAASAAASGAGAAQGGDLSSSAAGFSFEELSQLPEGRALLASTTPDYPVTPGDVYTLVFLKAADLATTTLVVQNDYAVNLGVFGQISGKGMSFPAFKAAVEKRVAAAYPGSAPEIILRSTGTFQVKTEGEVENAGLVQTWALERVSSVFGRVKTMFASERSVLVRSASGSEGRYDLFAARRQGDLAQDPYLRPGDVLILGRADRRVSLTGEVFRPGPYQLLPGEGLKALVEVYGEGLRSQARGDYAYVNRPATADKPEGELLFFDAAGWTEPLPSLADGDAVTVPNRQTYLPVVYFEGAIAMGNDPAKQYSTDRYPFKPGDTLAHALRAVADKLQPNADLRRAFLARKGRAGTIPVDLEKFLFAYDPSFDILLEPEDRIVIPTGSLDVYVTGEVTRSSWVNTTALTRLSAAIGPLLTKYSSLRDVLVRSIGGEERSYDLFRAGRYGELEQDPFLKPGDTVVVGKAERIVSIAGEVKRPGTYQLLSDENFKALIEVYGDGFSERANPERLTLVRAPTSDTPLGRTMYLSYAEGMSFQLETFDAISVPSISELLPVVYFEGAIGAGVSGEDPQAAKRVVYTFTPGDTISRAAQALRKNFTAVSDLKNAYIRRGVWDIPVDLSVYLYEKDFTADFPLEANDLVIIPFRQFFISVSGAVLRPGRYPYVPDRGWEYYVGLAGGVDPDRNAGNRLKILDVHGQKRPQTGYLNPEDTIIVASNSFLYQFGRFAAILSTVISVASLVISLSK